MCVSLKIKLSTLGHYLILKNVSVFQGEPVFCGAWAKFIAGINSVEIFVGDLLLPRCI